MAAACPGRRADIHTYGVHTAPHAGIPGGQGIQPAACALFIAPLLDFVEFRLHKILHQAAKGRATRNPERRSLYKRATALFPRAPCSVSPFQCPNWERVSGFCVYAGTPRLLIVRGRLATLTAQTLL